LTPAAAAAAARSKNEFGNAGRKEGGDAQTYFLVGIENVRAIMGQEAKNALQSSSSLSSSAILPLAKNARDAIEKMGFRAFVLRLFVVCSCISQSHLSF
jgi:hypothetical protein